MVVVKVKVGETWKHKKTRREYEVTAADLVNVSFKSKSTVFNGDMLYDNFIRDFEQIKEAA